MKNATTTSNKLQLNALNRYSQGDSQGKESKLLLALQRVWQSWVTEIITNNGPRICQTTNCLGNIWWHAYNPATGRSATRKSEIEILEWIDQCVTNQ